MRPLILTEDSRAEITRVRRYAEEHKLSESDLLYYAAGGEKGVANNPNFSCEVPFGFTCCFTMEENSGFLFRHISVAVSGNGYAPNPIAVEMLMKEFGFTGQLGNAFHIEEDAIGPGKAAINVWEKV